MNGFYLEVAAVVPVLSGASREEIELMQSVTYTELKALRDTNKLVAGTKYRITDYVTTTVQKETKSANHPFDVIVEAVSENELSELAQAIQHEGDTYFEGNDLGAWQLWYDLDNDTEKYAWADAENGKGVIYRMIDEKRNDCPYDFKNILFYNDKYGSNTTSDKYYYTFSYVVNRMLYDGTVEKQVTKCHSNSMGVYKTDSYRRLNKNTWKNESFYDSCYSNTFGNSCYSNTFGNYCYSNTFGNYCYSNTFGNSCDYNTFGNSCDYNTFGNSCDYNTFGNDCYYNTFGNDCYSNTFGNSCDYNTFGNDCGSNTFGDRMGNRQINYNKTSIILNEEYYDDGTKQLVPIKHPDLSTQPSILPYKFMGKYVYEQLIPTNNLNIKLDDMLIMSSVAVGIGMTKPVEINCSDGYITPSEDVSDYLWLKIVYTSMPEEGDYYGYNNY